MRVVHLSHANAAGVPQDFAQADRDHGHDAVHVSAAANDFGYPNDRLISNPGRSRAYDEIVRQADVVVAYDHPWYVEYAQERDRPVVFRGLGTATYDNLPAIQALDVPKGGVTIDMTLLGIPWMPQPVEARGGFDIDHDEPYLVHAPSNPLTKGTNRLRVAAQLAGLPLDVLTDLPHPECVPLKTEYDVLLDQIPADQQHPDRVNGYGTNGLEAMSVGQPVAGRASDVVRNAQRALLVELPYYELTEPLAKSLGELRDPLLRAEVAEAGLAYVRNNHDPQAVADAANRLYEEVT